MNPSDGAWVYYCPWCGKILTACEVSSGMCLSGCENNISSERLQPVWVPFEPEGDE